MSPTIPTPATPDSLKSVSTWQLTPSSTGLLSTWRSDCTRRPRSQTYPRPSLRDWSPWLQSTSLSSSISTSRNTRSSRFTSGGMSARTKFGKIRRTFKSPDYNVCCVVGMSGSSVNPWLDSSRTLGEDPPTSVSQSTIRTNRKFFHNQLISFFICYL